MVDFSSGHINFSYRGRRPCYSFIHNNFIFISTLITSLIGKNEEKPPSKIKMNPKCPTQDIKLEIEKYFTILIYRFP